MDWISTALVSATMQAGVSIVDSHLLSRRMLKLRTFMLAMSVIQVFFSLALYLISPWNTNVPAAAFGWVAAATVAGTSGALLVLFVLQKEEVSKVVPITHVSPVFVAIIATVFLDEQLEWAKWLAIFIVVAGAMIITFERSGAGKVVSLKKPFLLLFLASLLGALGSIFTKQALEYLSFWNMYSMSILGTAIIMLSVSLRPHILRRWRYMDRRSSTLALVAGNEIAALSASVLYVRAVSLGPVSLVATIMGTRPVLVALFSILLSLVLPGFLMVLPDKRTMLLRLTAILLIVGGLSIISLS